MIVDIIRVKENTKRDRNKDNRLLQKWKKEKDRTDEGK